MIIMGLLMGLSSKVIKIIKIITNYGFINKHGIIMNL